MYKNNNTITLRQLANKLGIATSTVSRALSKTDGVSDKRAEEIRQMALELGYRPQPLRRRMNKTIGLIISSDNPNEVDDQYQTALIQPALHHLNNLGWHLHFEVIKRGDSLPHLITENRVDGVILSGNPSESLTLKIKNLGLPAIVIDDLVERTHLTSIAPSAKEGAEEAVNKLISIGHKNIAMISTTETYPTVSARVEGFKNVMKKIGIKNPICLIAAESSIQQGQAATRQILKQKKKPTAIIYLTDRLAVGGMIELARARLSIPNDISIIGFDNTPISREMEPSLTSVDLNVHDMVKLAINLLKEMICDEKKRTLPPQQYFIKPSLIWRNSCSPIS